MKAFFTLLVACLCVTAFGQRGRPDPGITIYWDDNYHGESQQINADWVADGRWNDQISSIRVPQGYKIEVFEHGGFNGRTLILTSDWTVTGGDLRFNDIISSIRILERPQRQHHARYDNRGDEDNARACCGQKLGTLISGNKQFKLVYQGDNNLVVYLNSTGAPLWASNTGGLAATHCVMQEDGNLVIYNNQRAIWSSNTYGNPGAYVVMQDDGNAVIYNTAGSPLWATNTQQANYVVTMPQPAPEPAPAPDPTPVIIAPTPGTCSLTDAQFTAAKSAIDGQAFRDAKMSMAKQAIKNKCLSIPQIREIANMFSFEDQRLEFVKFAYDFNDNHDEYYTLSDVFAFNSNVLDFTAFLEKK